MKFDFQTSMKQQRELYLSGDATAVERYVRNPPKNKLRFSQAQLKILLDDRNRKWATVLETILIRRPTFVAVGAGHITGKNGLMALLQSRGFTISRVKEQHSLPKKQS